MDLKSKIDATDGHDRKSIDSIDEFGDFEGANSLSEVLSSRNSFPNAGSTKEIVPEGVILAHNDDIARSKESSDSIISEGTSGTGLNLKSPLSRIILQGYVYILRPKGGISHKIVRKNVRITILH